MLNIKIVKGGCRGREAVTFGVWLRACSTLVKSKIKTLARVQSASYSSSDFSNDLSDEKLPSEELKSPVCSYNEWDPLEEVIVGRVEGVDRARVFVRSESNYR
ncbi:glycine amidinotransferase, mitochondrial-like [Stylophora pistillata]|uniref:glycine amidinotransferase, mitochondrial-like n=1 Tax=Stylophora pistillata TaxID=50429 RepID=UPI000C03CF80|nr:glycine amidinotransferase, mitochondrial-like [Stylophora pistillata]